MTVSRGSNDFREQLQSVKAAQTSNLTGVYNNGPSNNGVKATLTISSAPPLIVDTISLNQFDRVVLSGQTDSTQNGIYFVLSPNQNPNIVLQRSDDFQSKPQIRNGLFFSVEQGAVNGGDLFIVTPPFPFQNIGTTGINFANISASDVGGVVLPADGGTGVASPTAHTLPVAEGALPFNFLGPLTNGQLLIGSTNADPNPSVLTAGGGVAITNGAGSITISAMGGGISWNDVTGTSAAMAVNNGYVADNAGLVTLTLPATAAFGSVLSIQGKGAGGWTIAQNAGQTIHIGASPTTTGVGGSVSSVNQWDSLNLVCVTADTTWAAVGGPLSAGLTIV